MRNLFIVFIPIALFSCIQDNPRITISNNTAINYDSIKVYSIPNIPTIFKNLGSKEAMDGQILFDKNNASDGAYTIQIYEDGIIVRQKCFGYYTNGRSLDRRIKVVIEPDTLKFNLIKINSNKRLNFLSQPLTFNIATCRTIPNSYYRTGTIYTLSDNFVNGWRI